MSDWSANHFQQYVLGTAGLGGVWGEVDATASIDTILHALDLGLMSIDTAPAYGDAESFVGAALRQWKGVPPRVSTNVGRLKTFTSDAGVYDYTPEGMSRSVERSLETLSVACIDLLFLHEPAAIPEKEVEPAVDKMIEMKATGIASTIGLGGNVPASFKPYIDAGIFDVVMEYNRLNACCVDALDESLALCNTNGIEYWAASPLFMGLLGSSYDRFVKAKPNWLPQQYINIALKLKMLAEKNGMQLPELAFRFLTTVPKDIKIVIGPSSKAEFNNCIQHLSNGPISDELFSRPSKSHF